MSEHNYFGLAATQNLKEHPEWFDRSFEAVNEAARKATVAAQALHTKNDAGKINAPEQRNELNRLLNDHFNLKQWVRGCEVRVNESANKIRNIEQRINSLIVEKQKIESPLGQRGCEHRIVLLEGELAEEKEKYEALRKENLQAVRQLKAFDVARLEVLKAELDAPKVVSK